MANGRARSAFATARRAAGYTQESLADALHVDRTTVARWESGDRTPLAYLRPRLARLLGCRRETLAELLGPPTGDAPSSTAGVSAGGGLADVLEAADGVDDVGLDALAEHLSALRRLDRSVGAVAAADGVRAMVEHVADLAHAVPDPRRQGRLLRLLAELHTLVGWVANDQGDVAAAWRHHNRARTTAAGAGSAAHVAHATAQQAVILAEAGHVVRAREQVDGAVEVGRRASPVVRAWLEASRGEVAAYAGERGAALRAFDRAARWVYGGAGDGEPYVGLDAAHLGRWRSQVLVQLADTEALTATRTALAAHDPAYKRAEASLRIDLARGLARVDRDAARAELRTAETTTAAVRSARLRRRAELVRAGL